jgi:hypothetical protein
VSRAIHRAGLGRTSGWRRVAAALGVLALLSHTLVILIHRPPQAAPVDAAMVMAMGPDCPMVMDGGDAAPAPGDADKAPRKRVPVCPICQTLQATGLFVAPHQPVIVVASRSIVTVASTRPSQPRPITINERARPRAPPAIETVPTTTLDG